MAKKDRVKQVGKGLKRVLDRGADRIDRMRTEVQTNTYNPQSLARDFAEMVTDTVDFFTSFLSGGSSHPILALGAPVASYNVAGGNEISEDSVSLDEVLDPSLALAASALARVGGAEQAPTDRVQVTIEQGGWVMTAKLLSKQNNADQDLVAGVYLGVIVPAAAPNVIVASIQLRLT